MADEWKSNLMTGCTEMSNFWFMWITSQNSVILRQREVFEVIAFHPRHPASRVHVASRAPLVLHGNLTSCSGEGRNTIWLVDTIPFWGCDHKRELIWAHEHIHDGRAEERELQENHAWSSRVLGSTVDRHMSSTVKL